MKTMLNLRGSKGVARVSVDGQKSWLLKSHMATIRRAGVTTATDRRISVLTHNADGYGMGWIELKHGVVPLNV